jgi:hypothetical protein
MMQSGYPLPGLSETEFRNFSQNGEDGILLFLATVFGPGSRRVVELGASDGIECNSANLIVHHGWQGLLIDGDAAALERGGAFYRERPETRRLPPTFVHAWVTRDNVRELLADRGFRDVDLLSVDVDGNDLWLLDAIQPTASLIVCEYNNRIPADVSVSVPYQENFAAEGDNTHGEGFFGASLQAFATLLAKHGYRLIGANSVNTNAFFTRIDGPLPSVSVESCLSSPWARHQQTRWWPTLERRSWQTIT